MKNTRKIIVLGGFALSLFLVQCAKEEIDVVVCTSDSLTYTKDIKPIMDASCATSGCHTASKKASGYDLSSYSGTIAGAGKTEFLGAIQHKKGYKKMPEDKPKLSQEELNKIACWVQNGKLE